MGDARDVYEEGALIFPAVQVQQDYQDIEDIIRMCQMRIRVPEQWWGDYLATLGAARIGERELLALGARGRLGRARRPCRGMVRLFSERRMIEAIAALPSGRVAARPAPTIRFRTAGRTASRSRSTSRSIAPPARIEVDLRDNPDCLPCGLNLTEALLAQRGDDRHLQQPARPRRADECRQLPAHRGPPARELHRRHPAPSDLCSVATTNLADRVANPVQRAIAELAEASAWPRAAPIIPPAVGVISGRDPRHGGAPFVNQVHPGRRRRAGDRQHDGWLT